MLNRVYRADTVKVQEISFHPSAAIEAAALTQGMMMIASKDMLLPELGGGTLLVEIGTGGDRWYGGILIVAAAMTKVIREYCRFDQGVFTYEYVEVDDPATVPDSNLSVWLVKAIDPSAWYQICDNWHQPTHEALTKVFLEWAHHAGVPTSADLQESNPEYNHE